MTTASKKGGRPSVGRRFERGAWRKSFQRKRQKPLRHTPDTSAYQKLRSTMKYRPSRPPETVRISNARAAECVRQLSQPYDGGMARTGMRKPASAPAAMPDANPRSDRASFSAKRTQISIGA